MIWFRLPFEQEIYTTDGKTDGISVRFVSFNEDKEIQFPGNIIPINEDDLTEEFYLPRNNFSVTESKKDYLEKIKKVVDFLKIENLDKLVISRRIPINFNKIDLKSSFLNLCKAFPNSFCYIFHQEDECWIGAFSELLGKFDRKNSDFTTMSLAGTLPVNEEWTQKEILEQKPVTNFIYNTLEEFSVEIYQSETYDHISGSIKHLRTDFRCKLNENQLNSLISELHPTPAVCGIPKEKSRDALQKFENHDRELYSGYSKIEMGNIIYYFVTLRCGKVSENLIEIFAGGGITQNSNPEKEWQETELKAAAILKNLVIS